MTDIWIRFTELDDPEQLSHALLELHGESIWCIWIYVVATLQGGSYHTLNLLSTTKDVVQQVRSGNQDGNSIASLRLRTLCGNRNCNCWCTTSTQWVCSHHFHGMEPFLTWQYHVTSWWKTTCGNHQCDSYPQLVSIDCNNWCCLRWRKGPLHLSSSRSVTTGTHALILHVLVGTHIRFCDNNMHICEFFGGTPCELIYSLANNEFLQMHACIIVI